MSGDVVALIGGALLAVAAIAYVLQPLFSGPRQPLPPAPAPHAGSPRADDIEARVRALRDRHVRCATCGIRPEADALFCSSCGRPIASD